MKRTTNTTVSQQMEQKLARKSSDSQNPFQINAGSSDQAVSTGSTLLDLAITGGRFAEGGIPTGILVEVFGPSGAGKTALLVQIAAGIQRNGGNILFHDPEGRLNTQFAAVFGLNADTIQYEKPDTVPEVFRSVRKWIPYFTSKEGPLHAVFADSLAALSSSMEMADEADKMGMRRAKEFSEELRKTCRTIAQKNALMICSNQIRQNMDAGPYGQKYKSPGGEAMGFYASLRLRCSTPQKIKLKRTINGVEYEKTIGTQTRIDVFKSSVGVPHRSADVFLIFDYGIDDIRGNLHFLKHATGGYVLEDQELGTSLDRAIKKVEEEGFERKLKARVITLWSEVEKAFGSQRKPKNA